MKGTVTAADMGDPRSRVRQARRGKPPTEPAPLAFHADPPDFVRLIVGMLLGLTASGTAAAEPAKLSEAQIAALKAGYPDHIRSIEGGHLIWADGSRVGVDDGVIKEDLAARLRSPDIEDMLSLAYPLGPAAAPPATDFDPGRIRDPKFFRAIYGDCSQPGFSAALVDVVWLPKNAGKPIKFNPANGAAEQLRKVSEELDRLPDVYMDYLTPVAQTFLCRGIAGTERVSGHAFGIAIDLNTSFAHYWRWTRPDSNGTYRYQNALPQPIVDVFEKHGFIWGGKWYHYDTMHFEYRPELAPPVNR